MTRLLHRHRDDESLIPVATARRAPSWPRRSDADAPISFADIAALPDPDWIGRDPNEPDERPDLMPGLVAVGATVRTLGVVYDTVAAEIEAVLSEIAALVPIVAEQKVADDPFHANCTETSCFSFEVHNDARVKQQYDQWRAEDAALEHGLTTELKAEVA